MSDHFDNLFFSEEHRMLRETARQFSEKEVAPLAGKVDEEMFFPRDNFKKMGELGLLGVTVDEQDGGSGLGAVGAAIVMEELGQHCASTSLSYGAHMILCINAIARHGNAEQKKHYLPALISGDAIGCWGLTEPGAGSDNLGMKTTAKRAGEEYVVNGTKTFITNAPYADTIAFYCYTDPDSRSRGISSFVAPMSTAGISTGKKMNKMGMRGSPTSEVFFEDVRLPAEALLGEENNGTKQFMSGLDVERSTLSAISVGIAAASLDYALKYAKDRKQFDKSIGEFQMIQKKIADMYVELEAARLLVYRAAALADKGIRCTKEASAAKLFASEIATRAGMEAVQILGGNGYIKEYPVERYARDAKLMEIGAGTSEIQRMVIFRELLKEI